MELFSVTSWLFGVLGLIVFYLWRKLTYWKGRGVPYATPIMFSKETRGFGKSIPLGIFHKTLYDQLKGKGPAGGITIFTNPIMMILDLDLIKNIMVKDFNVFPNRKAYFNEKDDPLTAHLVNLEDDEWRSLRTKLTPTFSSGKLKMMLPTIIKVTENLITKLGDAVAIGKSVEIKEFLSRFTVDTIGSTAFGIECNR